MSLKSAFSEGRQAFYMYQSNCPYTPGSDAAEEWILGYDDASAYWNAETPTRPGRLMRSMKNANARAMEQA